MNKELSLYTTKGFLDQDFCEEMCAILDAQRRKRVEVGSSELKNSPELEMRSNVVEGIDQKISDKIFRKLEAIVLDLESFFETSIDSTQDCYFIKYREGEYCSKHVDAMDTTEAKELFGEPKQLTAVIFLNDESLVESDSTFEGGSLVFHELFKDENFKDVGYPVRGETGKLIVFPARYSHEVTTVTRGTRYVVNSGFL